MAVGSILKLIDTVPKSKYDWKKKKIEILLLNIIAHFLISKIKWIRRIVSVRTDIHKQEI